VKTTTLLLETQCEMAFPFSQGLGMSALSSLLHLNGILSKCKNLFSWKS